MLFGHLQNLYFGAAKGAYSIVTDDERANSQITISTNDGESEIVIENLGQENIPRLRLSGHKTRCTVVQRDGTVVESELGINYPKQTGNELRIYRNVGAGFDYEAGDVWFVFIKDGVLNVGSMSETRWRSIGVEDREDQSFQESLAAEAPNDFSSEFLGKTYKRNPTLSKKAILAAGGRCEYQPDIGLFVSRATQGYYLEAHHLVPLYATPVLGLGSLDIESNIVALSPHWHRAIHHGEPDLVSAVVRRLFEKRRDALHSEGLSLDFSELERLYGCEIIGNAA